MTWPGLAIALIATALLAGCGLFGGDDEGDGVGGEIPTIDPTLVSGTVELSSLPPDGTIIIVNGRYYLMWEQAKARIEGEETTLEALQEEGVSEGDPVPVTPLAVADAAAGAAPTRWAQVFIESEDDEQPDQTVLYLIVDNQAHRIQPQPLTSIAEVGIADGTDASVVDRVQLPDNAPAAATPSPTP